MLIFVKILNLDANTTLKLCTLCDPSCSLCNGPVNSNC